MGSKRDNSRTAGSRKRKPARGRVRPRPAEQLITKAEAAERLGITTRRLEQMVNEFPDVPCQGRGLGRRFHWPALREWRDKQLVQQGVNSVRPLSFEQARARKLTYEADLAEIELAERRAQLLPTAAYRQEYEAACGRLRGAHLNGHTRYAPQLFEILASRLESDDLRRIEEFLLRMFREIMAEIEAGDDIPEDDEEPPAGAAVA